MYSQDEPHRSLTRKGRAKDGDVVLGGPVQDGVLVADDFPKALQHLRDRARAKF